MLSCKSAPPTRHPHEFITTHCTVFQHDSATTPHDPLCASTFGLHVAVTHFRPHPPPWTQRTTRSSRVLVKGFYEGSIVTDAIDKHKPKERKGQSFQSKDKHLFPKELILSVPGAPLVPAAEPEPPPPCYEGTLSLTVPVFLHVHQQYITHAHFLPRLQWHLLASSWPGIANPSQLPQPTFASSNSR